MNLSFELCEIINRIRKNYKEKNDNVLIKYICILNNFNAIIGGKNFSYFVIFYFI